MKKISFIWVLLIFTICINMVVFANSYTVEKYTFTFYEDMKQKAIGHDYNNKIEEGDFRYFYDTRGRFMQMEKNDKANGGWYGNFIKPTDKLIDYMLKNNLYKIETVTITDAMIQNWKNIGATKVDGEIWTIDGFPFMKSGNDTKIYFYNPAYPNFEKTIDQCFNDIDRVKRDQVNKQIAESQQAAILVQQQAEALAKQQAAAEQNEIEGREYLNNSAFLAYEQAAKTVQAIPSEFGYQATPEAKEWREKLIAEGTIEIVRAAAKARLIQEDRGDGEWVDAQERYAALFDPNDKDTIQKAMANAGGNFAVQDALYGQLVGYAQSKKLSDHRNTGEIIKGQEDLGW